MSEDTVCVDARIRFNVNGYNFLNVGNVVENSLASRLRSDTLQHSALHVVGRRLIVSGGLTCKSVLQ